MISKFVKNKVFFIITFSSFNKESLYLSSLKLKLILKQLNINFCELNFPLKKQKFTILRSPHVHKKSKEQFERIKYKKSIMVEKHINIEMVKHLLINYSKNVDIRFLLKYNFL